MKRKILLVSIFCCTLLVSALSNAETTTTTTTTNPDGSTTTQETTTTDSSPNPLGPKGVAGTLRRVERRDDYRKEEDLKDLEDALEDRPRPRR